MQQIFRVRKSRN